MARRRDPLTMDLLSWEPPQVAVGYSADVVGRGRLDARIARLVSHALRDAREDKGLSREVVAQKISDFLDRKVSVEMLYKWTSESSEEHRIPLDAFIALVHATKDADLLGFVPEQFGHKVIPAEYYELIEEQLLDDHIEEMQARKQVLAARRKAKR